ncbi:MAG: tetraacyldisaccharide 4'-kinase [Planctomycetota bacterium]
MPGPLRGPLPGVLLPLALLARWPYGSIIARRNAKYDSGRGVVTMDRPVISVGNLSVGGTGKTPAVQLICRWLVEAGHRPAIAMRGYAARDGLSDEAAVHREVLPDVPLAVRGDRIAGLIELFAEDHGADVDVVVLDDGFQHRRLARQLDVVLIDATRDPFADRMLPAGWLREPVDALARADAIVLTHAEAVQPSALADLRRRLLDAAPHAICVSARHGWAALDVLDATGDHAREDRWLRGKRYAIACAIGNPDAFIAEATRRFGPPMHAEVLRDHDPYAPATMRRLLARAADADALLVTQKDWAKLRRIDPAAWPCPVARPRLELSLDSGGEALQALALEAALWQDPLDDGPSDGR